MREVGGGRGRGLLAVTAVGSVGSVEVGRRVVVDSIERTHVEPLCVLSSDFGDDVYL